MSETRPLDDRFQRLGDGHYSLDADDAHETNLELRHVRRERYQIHGELTVRTKHVHARPMHGVLLVLDVNLSTARGLDDVAGAISRRMGGDENQWRRVADELGTAIAMGERMGDPSVRLTGERFERLDGGVYTAHGFRLPAKHPAILFGFGDTLKSYTAGAVAVELDRRGLSTLYVDGEMDRADHEDRVAALVQGGRTNFLRYLRCARPLVFEVDRIRDVIREYGVQYAIFDSVGFLAHDKPEASESALRYFAAVRALGELGSLHLAHRTNSEHGDRFPFGSQFWHNSARATWYADRGDKANETPGTVEIAYHCRKFNLGTFPAPHALRFTFSDGQTAVASINPATVPDLAKGLSVQRRIIELLKLGPATEESICESLDDVKPDTIGRTLRRHTNPTDTAKHLFHKLADGRYANVEMRRIA